MAFGDFIQAATAIDTTGTSATIGGAGFTSNVTAANFLILGTRWGAASDDLTSVASDSTPATFTVAKKQLETTDGNYGYIHHGVNQTGGVKPTLTISFSASQSIRAILCEYAGSSNTHVDTAIASTVGTSTAPSSGVTPTRTDATELQIGFALTGSVVTWTAGSGFTLRSTQPGSKAALEDVLRTSTGTQTADFSLSASADWAALTACYSDAVTDTQEWMPRMAEARRHSSTKNIGYSL